MLQIEKEKSPGFAKLQVKGLTSGASAPSEALLRAALSSISNLPHTSSSVLQNDLFLSQDDKQFVFQKALSDIFADIKRLESPQPMADSDYMLPPDTNTVMNACRWIGQLFSTVFFIGKEWVKPNVTASEDGEVVFEWWNKDKKLTVYVDEQIAEYIKVWGTNINTEMSDGSADNISTCQSLWIWLVSSENGKNTYRG